jgi:MFS family permease
MVGAFGLLRRNPDARRLIGARGLSAVGTGAAYVALMLVGYDRSHSAWIVSAVLAADLLPSILCGSIAGALADRWPRRRVIVASEALGAAAFAGLALTDGTVPLIALACLAGAATTAGMTALLPYLSDLFDDDELLAANSGFAAVSEGGMTAGMALAAGALLIAGPGALLFANAATFALAAVLIARTRPASEQIVARDHEPVLNAAREGVRLCLGSAPLRRVLVAGFAASAFLALVNVGEVVLARSALHGGGSAYSLLVAFFGVGTVSGALLAPRAFPRDPDAGLRTGLFLAALGQGGSAASPSVGFAIATFGVSGFASGFLLVHGRQLLHDLAPAGALGRVFGFRDQLGACAFGAAFLVAPLLIAGVGVRAMFLISGIGALAVGAWLFATQAKSSSERSANAVRQVVAESHAIHLD